MTPKELDDLLTVCRKHGVYVFSDGKIRLVLGEPGPNLRPGITQQELRPVRPGQRPMTDFERFAFAATEGYPDDEEAFVPVETEPKS